ncbi:MAG: D-tyrosyl-tRNA(Tyr) deacylase [Clostridia bacterium]|nr:D-tyrosyl-tRNA(Tyr) deacylase [Clostridia bacterium]
MKALIQRVLEASVSIDGKITGECKKGYMILFCAVEGDTEKEIDLLARKTVSLRVNEDEEGKMNKSVLEVGGEVLCISQFTLAADTRKGNRPSFIKAMEPCQASLFYDMYCEKLMELGIKRVEKGIFGADMKVSLINDGPVTVMLDTDVWKKGLNGS